MVYCEKKEFGDPGLQNWLETPGVGSGLYHTQLCDPGWVRSGPGALIPHLRRVSEPWMDLRIIYGSATGDSDNLECARTLQNCSYPGVFDLQNQPTAGLEPAPTSFWEPAT